MAGVSGFCAQGRCAQCDAPGCSCREAPHLRFHELDDPMLVLAVPACPACFDKDAEVAVVIWGWQAALCAEHADQFGSPVTSRRELRLGPGEPPLLTEAEAGAYVEAQEWKRARPTLRGRAQAAHEYLLLARSADPVLHLRVVAWIGANGERRRWGKAWHSYWAHQDFEYWGMGPRHTILNRRGLDW